MKKWIIVGAIIIFCLLYALVKFSKPQGKDGTNQVEDARIEKPAVISELEILEIKFDPIHQGKNIASVNVRNTGNKEQSLGIDVRVEGLDGGLQRQYSYTVKGSETKSANFEFEISDPASDSTSIRLRFYNPASACEAGDFFKEAKYTINDLRLGEIAQESTTSVSKLDKAQVEDVIKACTEFQSCLKDGKYEQAWELTSGYFKQRVCNGNFEQFKENMAGEGAGIATAAIHPESAIETEDGVGFIISDPSLEDDIYLLFIEEDGQWLLNKGQEARDVTQLQ